MHRHRHFSFFFFFFIFSLLFIFSLSLPIPTTSDETPSTCDSTLYPKLCRSVLSAFNRSSPSSQYSPYDYGKFAVSLCLKRARSMSELIHHRRWDSGNRREATAVEGCRELFALNVELLESIAEDLRSADDDHESMTEEQIDGIRSRLSAIVTNHQTCYDGLVVAKNGILWLRRDGTEAALSVPEIFNVRRLYSVTSGLVTQALISTNSTHHRHHHHHHHHHQHHHNHRKRDNVKGSGLPPATPPSQNVKGGSGNRLPPAPVAPVDLHRQPLEQFIKALKSTNCNSSSPKSCPREGQIQLGMEGSGILIRDIVIVSKDGTGNFTTIRDAVANLPNNTRSEDGCFVIYVKQGIYEEIIDISRYKKNIMLLGDGINRTVITGNLNAGDGQLHTFYTATFAVSGDRFIAIDITFRNTAGPTKGQAVAVRNQADLSAFYRCSLEGYQDTLYAHSRRQFYRECDIYGNVDFIFGDAAAVFQNCNIFVRNTRNHKTNYITAQGREDPDSNTGISIHNCTVDVAPDSATSRGTRTYLGRPWKLYSRTVYMQSYIGNLVAPAGWSKWNNGNTGLDTLYYGEFENYGPGANTRRRVRWPGFSLMSDSEALNFTVSNFTTGWSWLPDTDIPFSAGLMEST